MIITPNAQPNTLAVIFLASATVRVASLSVNARSAFECAIPTVTPDISRNQQMTLPCKVPWAERQWQREAIKLSATSKGKPKWKSTLIRPQ